MTYYPTILVDTGLLVAFYDSADSHHQLCLRLHANQTNSDRL
jgi:predicted nucleic acid-binding protein